MRSASCAVTRSVRWRWLWQHCLDSHPTGTPSRTFALRVRTTAARFPSQPRTTPAPSKSTPTTPPSSSTRLSRPIAPPITSRPLTDTAAAAISPQLALIEAEQAHQPDTALELLPLVDRQTQPLLSPPPQQPSQWTQQLSSASAFESASVAFAQSEQWLSLLSLYLAHPFHHPLTALTFVPSTAASQLAIEAAMELRDWDKVLRVHTRTLVYERRRQQQTPVGTAVLNQPASQTTAKPSRSTKRTLPSTTASSATYRVHACIDCVLYSAYRLDRHDLALSLFDVRSTPLASSHTTYILSCARSQQWQRVELWLASVDEAVWEDVEMAAVSTVMTAWRGALNQPHASHDRQQEQQRYDRAIAHVAECMMRVGAMSTPPQPVRWSDDFRVHRQVDGQHASFPLLIRPMMAYVSPLLVSALSTTTHFSEVDNMAAVITLTLLRIRSHLLASSSSSSPSTPPLFSLYIQPPHSSLTSWDVDAAVDALHIRGMSAFIRGSDIRAVMGGSDSRKAEEAKRREQSRELFESKGERRRKRIEEAAIARGEMEEEKQWVLEVDAETMQRWMDRTMLPWEKELLSKSRKQQQQQQQQQQQETSAQ